jgi:tetratricopeptide (TPR) repeat protein
MAVQVRYDAGAGRANAAGGFVEYPLCSASIVTGPSVGDARVTCPAGAAPAPENSEGALALGLALSAAHPTEARPLLGQALGDPQLSRPLRAAALDARAEAAEAIAETLPFAGAEFDRAAADALADDRAWVGIAPEDPEPQYAVARLLAGLGGYAEAEAVYLAIGRHWPDEAFNVAVRTGALYRRQGRYAEALRALDDYAAREGPPDGMKFHYHRAWTLTLLNRPAEVVDELTRGLATQPDYTYAFFMRACAYGRLGRVDEALADQERGLALLRRVTGEAGSLVDDQLAIAVESANALRQLAAARRSAPTGVACDRLWARDIRARPRSPLLGAR